jgi:hypothetical protein
MEKVGKNSYYRYNQAVETGTQLAQNTAGQKDGDSSKEP